MVAITVGLDETILVRLFRINLGIKVVLSQKCAKLILAAGWFQTEVKHSRSNNTIENMSHTL